MYMAERAEFYQLIGARIKALRVEKEKNQQEMADIIGLKRSSMAQIESGNQAISMFHAYLISKTLKISICDLLDTIDTAYLSFDEPTYARLAPKQRNEVMQVLNELPIDEEVTDGN